MPRRKKSEDSTVLDSAMMAFWTHGYASTSMQDIVDQTGASRAALYANYADKRAIFIAALIRYAETVRMDVKAKLKEKDAPLESIRRFFRRFSQGPGVDQESRGSFITNAAIEVAPHDPEVRDIIYPLVLEVERLFTELLKRAKADGSVAADLNARQAARGLLATGLGLTVIARLRPDPRLLNAVFDDALNRLRSQQQDLPAMEASERRLAARR